MISMVTWVSTAQFRPNSAADSHRALLLWQCVHSWCIVATRPYANVCASTMICIALFARLHVP